ncbi:MAG: hypothetical protein U1E05_03475 [Patescibacteria group bacterium]|nr:hypothetical protein [Patescibacteria group bacterium]
MVRPNLKYINLWENHERRVLGVLTVALRLLANEEDLPAGENELNRRLYFCILRAIRELHGQGVDLISYPIYEGNNQPDASDEERATRENKRPDFQFGFIDHQEPNPDASARQYVIECKRLGESGRSDWVLNTNYVEHGVMRFHADEYGYGKSRVSGAMIGYIQTSVADQILASVNQAADARSLSRITLSREGWQRGDVSSLSHRFNRVTGPTPFSLRHLWLDLLDCDDH